MFRQLSRNESITHIITLDSGFEGPRTGRTWWPEQQILQLVQRHAVHKYLAYGHQYVAFQDLPPTGPLLGRVGAPNFGHQCSGRFYHLDARARASRAAPQLQAELALNAAGSAVFAHMARGRGDASFPRAQLCLWVTGQKEP